MLFSAHGDKKSITGSSIARFLSCCRADSFIAFSLADPYYGGGAGFERAYQQCVRYSREFLDVLAEEGLVGGGDGSKVDV